MTPAEFRAHLDRLRWTQRGLAASLAVPHNTVHRWALGQATIPPVVAGWLEAMTAHMDAAPPAPTRESSV